MTAAANAYQAAREAKDAHPEYFCWEPRCLWRIVSVRKGFDPCPKHMRAELDAADAHADAAEADGHASYVEAIEGGT